MLIPYLGDKSKLNQFILPNIPEHDIYCEPFGGMFGLFLSNTFEPNKVIYNDINYYNYNLFNYLKDFKFIENVNRINITPGLFNIAKNKIKTSNDFDKSIYWLIILTCTNNLYDVMDGDFKGTQDFDLFKLKYINILRRLDLITNIHNIDYKYIIEKYDSTNTFFYLDPPYFGKENFYIEHNFTVDTHYELSEVLKNIKGKFALSYYKFPDMNDLYSHCNIKSYKSIMNTEYLIMNY